jgi:hypothetical protein
VAYEPEWTLKKLLKHIRKQQVESMRHEGIEFQQIAQRRIKSPEAEAVDLRLSMVNHRKAPKLGMLLGATVYRHTVIGSKQPYTSVDFGIDTVEAEDGSLSVSIEFAADRIPDELARTLSDRFRGTLETILANPHCSVSYVIEKLTGTC